MKTATPGGRQDEKLDTGLDSEERALVAAQLARVLADSYVLYVKTHAFHWNVTGPQFASLHALFATQYEDLAAAIDDLAERIRSLGGLAPGSFAELTPLATVRERKGAPAATAMVAELLADHETVARTCRAAIVTAQEASDEATVDLLVGRLAVHEKTAWMLRAQGQVSQ